jgi:hypothetical protein
MFLRKFGAVCVLTVCLAGSVYAQVDYEPVAVSLTVDRGFPLQVALASKVRLKENEPVRGKVVEAVYAFDQEVIPVGAEVEGRIAGFEKTGKWKRVFSMLGGDFTPPRTPQITFETLVLPDGTRIPMETLVVAGTDTLVKFDGQKSHAEKHLKTALLSIVDDQGKGGVKTFLWSLSPFRPQSWASGTRVNAILMAPLEFGATEITADKRAAIGSTPPPGSAISARLITPLHSQFTETGDPVEGVLTQPLYSSDQRLIFPAGSIVRGEVMNVKSAKKFHRNAELTFQFTTIEPPPEFNGGPEGGHNAQSISGHLNSLVLSHEMNDVRIGKDGGTRISESKKRFISPAYAFFKAGRGIDSSADSFGTAVLGAYQSKATKQLTGGQQGLGLPGSITGAMVPHVGLGLGIFGAARSVYSNFIGNGQDIAIPANTLMEIRLD